MQQLLISMTMLCTYYTYIAGGIDNQRLERIIYESNECINSFLHLSKHQSLYYSLQSLILLVYILPEYADKVKMLRRRMLDE